MYIPQHPVKQRWSIVDYHFTLCAVPIAVVAWVKAVPADDVRVILPTAARDAIWFSDLAG
jgi:hypothetical protein